MLTNTLLALQTLEGRILNEALVSTEQFNKLEDNENELQWLGRKTGVRSVDSSIDRACKIFSRDSMSKRNALYVD